MRKEKKTRQRVGEVIALMFVFTFAVLFTCLSCGADVMTRTETITVWEPIGLDNNTKTASSWIEEAEGIAPITATVTLDDTSGVYTALSNELTFTAGEPYILEIENTGTEAHYFNAQEFFKAIATEEVETSQAHYEAPYVYSVEIHPGRRIEIHFVAVVPGKYAFFCTNDSHAVSGLYGTITIDNANGLTDTSLNLEVATDYDSLLDFDLRRDSSHPIWASPVAIVVDHGNAAGALDFFVDGVSGADLNLASGIAYVITHNNPSSVMHHWDTRTSFFKTLVTRKADDVDGEIKVPYFKHIGMLPGGSTDLYIVPTEPGAYQVICSVPGHEEAGMVHNVVVQ